MAQLKTFSMGDVQAEQVRWLWEPYIPLGKITIIQGDPGDGKTTMALAIAAAVTSGLPLPDAVFIGGHGGRLFEMMRILTDRLRPGGRMVINAVTDDSRGAFIASCAELGLLLADELRIGINEHNPLSIITAEKPN